MAPDRAASREVMADPSLLAWFAAYADSRGGEAVTGA
jgi:hypothetical protein